MLRRIWLAIFDIDKFTWGEKHEAFCQNITKSNYGVDCEDIRSILGKLTEIEVEELSYNCYRTAEKIGFDNLTCDEIIESEF